MGEQEGARSSGLELLKIIQDALDDDRVALEKLMVWIRRRLRSTWTRNKKGAIISVNVRNEEDQKELCGEVLAEIVLRFRGSLPCAPDKADSYLARIVTNKAVDFHRRRATAKRQGENLVPDVPEPVSQDFTMDEYAAIHDFIIGLPECEGQAIRGYINGESAQETAARTGIPLGTLKDCRMRVRKLVQETFGK